MQDDELAERLRKLADEALAQRGTGGPLERLTLLRRLRTLLDTAEGDAMQHARRHGYVWAAIGDALGVSGQAAGQRFRRHHQRTDPRSSTGRRRLRLRNQ